MLFAYLQQNMDNFGANLVAKPDPSLPEDIASRLPTSLLKARTCLSVLYDNNMLKFEQSGDWLVAHPDTNYGPLPYVNSDVDYDALIPMKLFVPAWEQPGIAAIRNTLEVRTIFFDSFLGSSKQWLAKHPTEAEELHRRLVLKEPA